MTVARSRERFLTPQFILITASGGLYFTALGTGIAVIPVFAKHTYGTGDAGVGVAVGAFAVGAVILRPFAGRIGDRIGRRPLIIGGAAVVAASILMYLAATSLPLLVAFRLFGGIGEAARGSAEIENLVEIAGEGGEFVNRSILPSHKCKIGAVYFRTAPPPFIYPFRPRLRSCARSRRSNSRLISEIFSR